MDTEPNDDKSIGAGLHANEEVCNDILLGIAARRVVEQWTAHFSECAECERRFQRLAGEIEILRSQPVPQPIPLLPQRRFVGVRLPVALAAAATIVVTLAAGQFWLRKVHVGDFWLPVQQHEITLRSDGSDGASAFDSAMRIYEERDAPAAIAALRAPLPHEGYDLMRQVYLASALLQNGDPQAALDGLDALQVQTLPQPWRSRSLWIRYGCLRELGEDSLARALLAELAKDPGPIGNRARLEQNRQH